jgi:hypothetical protein
MPSSIPRRRTLLTPMLEDSDYADPATNMHSSRGNPGRQKNLSLAICQRYDKGLHGHGEGKPNGHHLVLYCQDKYENESGCAFLESWSPGNLQRRWELDAHIDEVKWHMRNSLKNNAADDWVLSTRQVNTFPRLDLVELVDTPQGYLLGIKKTFWINILKRTWLRKYYAKQGRALGAGRYAKRPRV